MILATAAFLAAIYLAPLLFDRLYRGGAATRDVFSP